MAKVSIRDLRNRGGDIVTMAAAGEPVTITRAGEPVAELRALGPHPLEAARLVARWKGLPVVDYAAVRRDVDAAIHANARRARPFFSKRRPISIRFRSMRRPPGPLDGSPPHCAAAAASVRRV